MPYERVFRKRLYQIVIFLVLIVLQLCCSAPSVTLKKEIRDDISLFQAFSKEFISARSDTARVLKLFNNQSIRLIKKDDKGELVVFKTSFPDTPYVYSILGEKRTNFTDSNKLQMYLFDNNIIENIFGESIELSNKYELRIQVFSIKNPSNLYKYCLQGELIFFKQSTMGSNRGKNGEQVIIYSKYYNH